MKINSDEMGDYLQELIFSIRAEIEKKRDMFMELNNIVVVVSPIGGEEMECYISGATNKNKGILDFFVVKSLEGCELYISKKLKKGQFIVGDLIKENEIKE